MEGTASGGKPQCPFGHQSSLQWMQSNTLSWRITYEDSIMATTKSNICRLTAPGIIPSVSLYTELPHVFHFSSFYKQIRIWSAWLLLGHLYDQTLRKESNYTWLKVHFTLRHKLRSNLTMCWGHWIQLDIRPVCDRIQPLISCSDEYFIHVSGFTVAHSSEGRTRPLTLSQRYKPRKNLR